MIQRRRVVLLDLVGSTAVIGGALLFQYVGGLQPCELCLIERWPYYAAIPLLLLALAAGVRRPIAPAILAVVLIGFLAGSAVAVYHVGVEQHWFAGPSACTGPASAAHTIAELKAQLLNQQPVRCDVVQWSLFGVSLAGWNLIASLALAGLSLSALRARGGRRRR
jgi:disulfide bond formation protein DsbB